MIVSDERVSDFASRYFKIVPPYTCMGLERNGQVIAAAVFNHYERTDIHVTVCGRVRSAGFIRAVGWYVFQQLGCLRMTAITEKPQIVAMGLRLGGEIEGRLRNHFGPGRDGIIIGILKEEWRYGQHT